MNIIKWAWKVFFFPFFFFVFFFKNQSEEVVDIAWKERAE